jgi:class 3 adenylate cyclase
VYPERDLRQKLKPHALFSGLGPGEFDALFAQLRVEDFRNPDRGVVVFEQDAPATSCFLVVEGAVDIVLSGQVVGRCRPGQLIGELGLIGGADRHQATAVAAEPSTLIEIGPDLFRELLGKSAAFSQNVVRALAAKLRFTTDDSARAKAAESRYFHILSSHVSPPVLQYLMARDYGVEVPQMLPNAVVMFADVQDYSRLTLKITDPVKLAAQLNEYFGRMTSLVHEHEGVVNAFLGDGLLAYWGFPKLPKDALDKALVCATKMHAEARQFKLGIGQIVNRIGLAAGDVFCGIVGQPPVEQFTILGSVVNLAARLEQANKVTGTSILVEKKAFRRAIERMADDLPPGFGPFIPFQVEARGFGGEVECLGLRYDGPSTHGKKRTVRHELGRKRPLLGRRASMGSLSKDSL